MNEFGGSDHFFIIDSSKRWIQVVHQWLSGAAAFKRCRALRADLHDPPVLHGKIGEIVVCLRALQHGPHPGHEVAIGYMGGKLGKAECEFCAVVRIECDEASPLETQLAR